VQSDLEDENFDIKRIIFSKISRKLTLLFVIVAVIAPIMGIYYFYITADSTISGSLFANQDNLFRTVALTIILLIAVNAGVIGYFVSRSITKPIKKLYDATKEVEKGNYDIRLNINTHDEIEELAKAFNTTTAALGRMQNEKREVDTAKTEFLSITSHELRTPMTPMKAQLQMLQEEYFGKLKKSQKESITIILRNADRLDKIIVDFLEISRIEAARLRFDFKKIDLKQIVNDTTSFMKGFAKEKNIKLVANTSKLPIIEADADRTSQVLGNLINNAIKFSKENSKINITAKAKEDHILFSVEDYGYGMTKEDQIRVFEPFYQVDNTLRRKHGGTGLGLAICRGIVEAQKGKIWVKSIPGEGSKFFFTVPLKPVRKIEPIKVLFSQKTVIEKKIQEEFKTMLGPLGIGEFNELKNKNAINKEDIYDYINTLSRKYILDKDHEIYFKNKVGQIFGDKKEVINNEKDIAIQKDGRKLI